MSEIKAQLIDQQLVINNSPLIASGGVNENKITFSFSDEWSNYIKTAVFYQSKNNIYYKMLDGVNTVTIPQEVTSREGTLYIGVIGSNGDDILTSEVVKYRITLGAISQSLDIKEPTDDIYNQIIDLVQTLARDTQNYATTLEKVIEDYQKTWDEKVTNVLKNAEAQGQLAYSKVSAINIETFDMDGGAPGSADYSVDIDGGGASG